jgi:hypothetical protein
MKKVLIILVFFGFIAPFKSLANDEVWPRDLTTKVGQDIVEMYDDYWGKIVSWAFAPPVKLSKGRVLSGQ